MKKTENKNERNPMNPSNIQPGDTVVLADEENAVEMTVQTVGGTYGNKVYCEEVGHELYATCFTLVRKGHSQK
jgi:hypothetical protein